MSNVSRALNKVFDFFASLKLAVFVVLMLAAISSVGTFVESRYDALTAKKLVYESWWMVANMALLVINLVFSAVDRLPWKKKHIPFLCAHVGIIVIIIGSYITQRHGVDGSMVFGIGQTERLVSVQETDLVVYASEDGDNFAKLFEEQVDFLKTPPSAEDPMILDVPGKRIVVDEFWPYAKRDLRFVSSPFPKDGPAVQFQLTNGRANVLEWVIQERSSQPGVFDMGPAQVVVSQSEYFGSGKNEIIVTKTDKPDIAQVMIFRKDQATPFKKLKMKAGDELETPWMGLKFKMLNYIPQAEIESTYKKVEFPTPLTTSAIRVSFDGTSKWVGLNSYIKIFGETTGYVVSYGNRRLDTGFDMQLVRFEVGRYPGTQMAKTYESRVYVPSLGEQPITMNEPLKHNGFTFYQASFQENQMGEPVASVLSVNRDPGRWIKYVGCSILVFGIILLFYFKRDFLRGSS